MIESPKSPRDSSLGYLKDLLGQHFQSSNLKSNKPKSDRPKQPMNKQWFLIKSLGATVDLSLVSYVIWNHVSAKKVYTEICLGVSPNRAGDMDANTGNEWWIHDPADRKHLQSALRLMGLPTTDLIFDADKKSIDL